MKQKLRKFFEWVVILLITVGCITSLFFLNRHLKNENLLFYATGSNKKAIINANWEMSPKEVERANKCVLKNGISIAFFDQGLNNLLDMDRIKTFNGPKLNLFSSESGIVLFKELNYEFFDNRLFRFRILGEVYNPNKFDSIAVSYLSKSYGTIKRDAVGFDGTFNSDSTVANYKQFDIDGEDGKPEHRFLIEVFYTPLYNEIIKIGKKEQESIFH